MKWPSFAALILGGLLLGLGIGEAVLRLVDAPKEYQPTRKSPQFSRVANLDVLYVNAPGTSIDFVYDGNPRGYFRAGNLVRHVTNEFGFRGPGFSREKKPGTLRFAFFGDSFTFGEGVYEEDTYPQRVAAELGRRAVFGSRPLESLNFGVGGYNTRQVRALLESVGDDIHADMAIVAVTLNDAEPYLFVARDNTMVKTDRDEMVKENPLGRDEPPSLVGALRVTRLAWQAYSRRARAAAMIRYYRDLYRETNPDWIAAVEAWKGIGEFARQRSLPVLVVVFPILYRVGGEYPFGGIHETIHAALEANGLDYVDVLPLLKGRRDADLWVHPTDQHPNELVHAMTAVALADRIAERYRQRLDPGPGPVSP